MNYVEIEGKKFEILLSNDAICKRTRLMAIQLNVDYDNRCPVFIGILIGSFMFMADLLKEVNMPCEVGFIRVASYQGTTSTGQIKEAFGLPDNLQNREVIIVEDIVDTGFTLAYILAQVKLQNPASVKICSLLFKPAALQTPIAELTYVGFEIANEFVVGYGLDYNGLGRNLNAIYKAV